MNEQVALEGKCINTIRFLAVDAIEKAKSGHPGLPMGAAAAAYTLWTRHLKHNPADPLWTDRDRFVLSAGHGSMLLYALLHLTGYDLSLDDLRAFRQWGSKTPGHPERRHPAGNGDDDGSPRTGVRRRGGDGDRRGPSGGALQPSRPSDRGPFHLRSGERRRPHGGALRRGCGSGRPSGAREAHRPLRRQPDLPFRLHGPEFHRGDRPAL